MPCNGTHLELTDTFRQLCQHAGVAIIATDASFRITFWNDTAQRLLGASSKAMTGQAIMDIVPEERRELARRLLLRTQQRGEVTEFEFRHRDPQGRHVDLAVTVSPLNPPEGDAPSGVSVILRNLTRRLDYEREQAQSRKMSALGVMAGAIAHHFNNLFGGILTSIEFAQDSSDARTLRRALKTTAESLGRATEMTIRLLAFAEGDRSRSSGCSLSDTISGYLDGQSERFSGDRIELESRIEEVDVELPARQILSIIDNLVTNACEAMQDGGRLTVNLERVDEGRTVLLTVADSGRGLDEEQLRRAFEPFYTSKPDPSVGQGHTGLGLPVVHGIVRDLGGSVTLSSSPSGGALCSIRIPTSCFMDRDTGRKDPPAS